MKAISIISTSLNVVGGQVQDILEGDNSSDESTSDSIQEKFHSDLSIDHHPLRTNEYILSYKNEVAEEEEEEDNEEEKNSDWIVDNLYKISKECYAFKNNTLRSQANPSALSDIKILAMNDIYLFSNDVYNSITKHFLHDMHKLIMDELKCNKNIPEMPDKAPGWCTEISNDPPTDWISAITKASGFLSDAITSKNMVDIHTAHILVQTLPMFVSRSPLSTVEDTYVQQILSPILQSIFNSDERFEIQWANAELTSSGLKTYKPDFKLFSRIINVKCVLLVSYDLAPPYKYTTGLILDHAK